MMRWLAVFCLTAVLAGWCLVDVPAQVVQPGDPKTKNDDKAKEEELRAVRDDEALLRKLGLPTDVKGLLQYFRERTFPPANPQVLSKLIAQLSSDEFPEREEAYKKIETFGTGAVFSLKKAKDNDDIETRIRINQLLKKIEDNADPRVQMAVARLIAHHQPADAVPVMLQYLPFAADEMVVDEMRDSLAKLAVLKGKTDPALVAALQSQLPLTRKIAGEALVRGGAKDQFDAARKLLKDKDHKVRLRLALAFAEQEQIDAVPVLIDVLRHLPPDELWAAENLLVRLAGDKSPEVSLGTAKADREKVWKAWSAWWGKQDMKTMQQRLAKLDQMEEYRGYIQVVYQTQQRVVGAAIIRAGREIMELGTDKNVNKPRWRFTIENTYPVDAQVFGNNRLLLTEYNGRRVSVRDFDGRILQTHHLPTYPISGEKLANGSTFVAMRNKLVEFDRNWKQVWTYNRNNNDIYRASKMRDGTVVFINNSGTMYFLNSKTNQITKSINIGPVGTYYGGIEVLTNGNVLVPRYNNHQVVEYNRNGRPVWTATVQWPTTAARLPNGDTVVGSINTRRLVQINRRGQEVWSQNLAGQIYRVRVR